MWNVERQERVGTVIVTLTITVTVTANPVTESDNGKNESEKAHLGL